MGRRSWGKPDFRDLTVEELSNLLCLSYTDSRDDQRDYLVSLVGFVTYPDLDYMLSVGRDHEEARLLAKQRVQAIDESRFSGAKRVSETLIDAVNYFVHRAIRGDFGPDDSRDGRMPVLVLQERAFFFSRLTLFRKLGLRAFPLCDIGWVDTDAKELQFDYSTSPIDCEMDAVAAKQMLASVSGNPLLGRLESCWTFHTLHAW